MIDAARRSDMQVIGQMSDRYPSRLKHTPHAPLVLFYRGNVKPNTARTVGIVGTRRPSALAKLNTEKLVSELKNCQVTVISGLAYGIDACAHKSAVDNGIPTIGVLGGAIDKIYPSSHGKLMQKMMDQGGVISEFQPGVKPEREHFPMRNRIISGMADLVVVVESGVKGGSMISAKLASDYNREVGAFPGLVGDKKASGCNLLIKEYVAHLIEGAADVLAIMQWNDEVTDSGPPEPQGLSSDEKAIFNYLRENGPTLVDIAKSDLEKALSSWSMSLLSLEMMGVLGVGPGNMIELKV